MSRGRLFSILGITVVLALVVCAFVAIDLPIRFTYTCRLLAQAEWVLLKTGPDTFEAHLRAANPTRPERIDLYRFQRGDRVRFQLTDGIDAQRELLPGQEVAHLHSEAQQQELEELLPFLRRGR